MTEPASSVRPGPGWGARVAAMGVIAAVGVSIIYVPQPIQTLSAAELGVSAAESSGATVAVQAGYALGVVLLVSLGDRLAPRRQVSVQLAASAVAILIGAAAPNVIVLVAMMFVAGAAGTVGQILVSSALRLAPPERRARTSAVLVGSFLVGLFTVRTVLGWFADALGWRTVLVGAAILVAACIPLAVRFAPAERPPSPQRYGVILATIPRVFASSRSLRLLSLTHTLAFAAFISTWSMVTLYGVTERELTVAQTATLGLAGLVGGTVTVFSAPLQSALGPRRALPLSLGALILGCVAIAFASHVLVAVVIGLFLIAFGMSSEQVSSQAVALASVDPAVSGRANTVYMGMTFAGSTIATALAVIVMNHVGYAGVGLFALGLGVAALVVSRFARVGEPTR